MTDPIKNLITSRVAAHVIRDAARKVGMRTLREDGVAKSLAGLTTIEEVIRVTELE